MALDPTFAAELRASLASFGARSGAASVPNAPGKALELWLQLKLATVAQTMRHWTVTLRDGSGAPLSSGSWILRANPQGLGPLAPSSPGWVHLAYTPPWVPPPGRDLEIHGGLQWLGRSGASHECDVSILPAIVADQIRSDGGGCPQGLPVLMLECKDKTSKGNLDEIRQTLARVFDLAIISQASGLGVGRILHSPNLPGWGGRSSQYRAYFRLGLFGIVRAGEFQTGAKSMNRHYHIKGFDRIYDTSSDAVPRLESAFRRLLTTSLQM
ncbi:MAG TPA: hypothetical protein VG248_04975 [Caulobacteraceae bacterium]|jgi:hypothetical protein|nr:hypothetical protein [Caulobacteraceae bacterium]